MLNRIIRFSLENRLLILSAAILLIFAFNVDFTTNISANPKIKCRYTLFAPPQSLYIVYM